MINMKRIQKEKEKKREKINSNRMRDGCNAVKGQKKKKKELRDRVSPT